MGASDNTDNEAMNEAYFQYDLMDETRALALSYQLEGREELFERFPEYMEAFSRMNETKGRLTLLEKHRAPPNQVEPATVETEAASQEQEERRRTDLFSYLETFVFPKLNPQDSSNEIVEAMMKCAILHQATPKGLAQFCSESEGRGRWVHLLLDSCPQIMKEMLLNGGATTGSNYGRAHEIYRQCLDLIEDVNDPIYGACHQRLAMAVALEHASQIEGFDTKGVYIDPLE